MYDIHALRQQEFPHSQKQLYFNHASISPLPQRTKEKMQWVMEQLAHNPGRYWLEQGMPLTEQLADRLAHLINAADPAEIVPITTTSAGLNALAQAINWQPGDNLIFCELEFPANAYPWLSLARDGVEVRQAAAVDGGLTLETVQQTIDENTRLVAASAIQFFSGHRTDLAAIGHFCRERNILFVVDAIQAIGHMPIDVQAMQIDALATGGQKSLLAPPGIGFMYVRRSLAEQMHPRCIGSNATVDCYHWLKYDLTPLPAAQRFQSGTPNLIGLVGLYESLELLQELNIAHIDQHTRHLSTSAIKQLQTRSYQVITPHESGRAPGPIVTFCSPFASEATDALVTRLAGQGAFIVKHLDAAGNPHLRLSFHCYNTLEEVAQFIELLPAL